MFVQILCEGPMCNEGISAKNRETDIMRGCPSNTDAIRDEAMKFARSQVSKVLKAQPHKHVGTDGRGHHVYACDACGHERFYGNTSWVPHYDTTTGSGLRQS